MNPQPQTILPVSAPDADLLAPAPVRLAARAGVHRACAPSQYPTHRAQEGGLFGVASSLIDTLTHSLDEQDRAGPDTVRLALDQVGPLADGVRDARMTEIVA